MAPIGAVIDRKAAAMHLPQSIPKRSARWHELTCVAENFLFTIQFVAFFGRSTV